MNDDIPCPPSTDDIDEAFENRFDADRAEERKRLVQLLREHPACLPSAKWRRKMLLGFLGIDPSELETDE